MTNNFSGGVMDPSAMAGIAGLSTGAPAQGEEVLTGFNLSTEAPKKEGFGDTPLTDFWMTGAGFMVKGGAGRERINADGTKTAGRPWQRVHFFGVGLEVLASEEPYPHPTASFSLFYSDPDESFKRRPGEGMNEWDAWCEPMRALGLDGMAGFNRLFGGQVMSEGQQPAQLGMRMHIMKLPTLIQVGPDQEGAAKAAAAGDQASFDKLKKWHPEMRPTLRIVEVEGLGTWAPEQVAVADVGQPVMPVAAVPMPAPVAATNVANAAAFNIVDHVLNIANGKTVDQFYQAVADDAVAMANPSLVPQITGRQYHQTMISLNRLRLNDAGVLERV